jgi:Ca-activated chloride channel family protein
VDRARRSDVLVYPIALAPSRPPVFDRLSAVSGGRALAARDRPTLTTALTGIARELRAQYLLGYAPPEMVDGQPPRWRSIRVTVNRPNVRVRAREGYFAN